MTIPSQPFDFMAFGAFGALGAPKLRSGEPEHVDGTGDRGWAVPGMFGQLTLYALSHCAPEKLRDPDVHRAWLTELLSPAGIDMVAFGEPQVDEYGHGSLYGISVTQLITTSTVLGYEDRTTGTFYAVVISCKPYEPDLVNVISRRHFGTIDSRSRLDMLGLRTP